MRARLGWAAIVMGLFAGVAAADEPKPQVVDLKPLRDKLLVFQDAKAAVYAVDLESKRVWYGAGKELYQQREIGYSADGDAWTISTWAPRVQNIQPGYVQRTQDGTYKMSCGDDEAGLTQVTGDHAKQLLDKHVLMTPVLVRRPRFFARDDAAVYYYVDVIGGGFGDRTATSPRLFVGKKGAVKEIELTDSVMDTAGEVFTAKIGELRLVHNAAENKQGDAWIHGDKRTELIKLDPDANSHVIFSELGIYKFLGTMCDNY